MADLENFLGRKEQIKSITKFLSSDKNNAALVYGRRRESTAFFQKQDIKKLIKNIKSN